MKNNYIKIVLMSRIFTKRIHNEIAMYKKNDFTYPNLYIRPLQNDLHKWYFIVYNLVDTDFEGGYYFGHVKLSTEYPLKAPDFIFYTPNGRFEVNHKICTSFSSYHQNSYSSSQIIVTMLQGLISFMTDTKKTTGIGEIKNSREVKQKYAQESIKWNKTCKLYNDIFGEIDVEGLVRL